MRILSVTPKQDDKARSWWLVAADDGQKYATQDMWIATLADRFREQRADVSIMSSAGWYYRNLTHISEAPAQGRGNSVAGERETVTPGHGETDPGTSPKGAA